MTSRFPGYDFPVPRRERTGKDGKDRDKDGKDRGKKRKDRRNEA